MSAQSEVSLHLLHDNCLHWAAIGCHFDIFGIIALRIIHHGLTIVVHLKNIWTKRWAGTTTNTLLLIYYWFFHKKYLINNGQLI